MKVFSNFFSIVVRIMRLLYGDDVDHVFFRDFYKVCNFPGIDGFGVGSGNFKIVFPVEMLMCSIFVDPSHVLAVYGVSFYGADVFLVKFAFVLSDVFEISTMFFGVFCVEFIAYGSKSWVIVVCVGVLLFRV